MLGNTVNQKVAQRSQVPGWRLTPLAAALLYARAGYPVLPVWPVNGATCGCHNGTACPYPGKHPIGEKWQHRATTDTRRLRAMFRRHPHAHVGIRAPAGHVIIDIDPRNDGDATLKNLLADGSIPTTPTQMSGGGGTHYIFKGAAARSPGKGIDLITPDNGFVVAWPSGHVSGGNYSWRDGLAPWDIQPAKLPEALRGQTRKKPVADIDTQLPSVPVSEMRKMLAKINADDRERWVNIGQALRHYYGDDEGRALWTEWSQTSDKWKESEDPDKWESFDQNRDRPLWTIRSIRRLAKAKGYCDPITSSSPSEFQPTLLGKGDLSGMTGTEPQPIEWAMEPFFPAGKTTLLAGAGGSSKSFLTLTLAMQYCIRESFGPFKPGTTGKALLLVAEEDQQDIHRRVRAITQACQYTEAQCAAIERNLFVVSVRGEDWRLLYHDEAGDLHETDRVQYLIDEIRNKNIGLVGFDPLVFFNGADENSNTEMSKLMSTFDRIASETGAAVLVLHHVSKGGQITSLNEATQAVVRGASALVDNARGAILLARMPRKDAAMFGMKEADADRHIVARHMKTNAGPHMADAIFAVGAGGALRYAPEVQQIHRTATQAARVMDEESTYLAVLAEYDNEPEATQREIADRIKRNQSTVKRTADRLYQDGLLRREVHVGRNPAFYPTKKGKKKLAMAIPKDDTTG